VDGYASRATEVHLKLRHQGREGESEREEEKKIIIRGTRRLTALQSQHV
jgi:hypothetical protein